MKTTEIFLDEINFSDLKQAFDMKLCSVSDLTIFSDIYHNISYYVPSDVASDKWSTIYFVVDLMLNDYKS